MIYLISKIDKTAHKHNECISAISSNYFNSQVFIPHKHNPFDTPHNELEFQVFNEDLNVMKRSDIAVVSLPIGRDCSAEIGWFCGANKYVCTFVIETPYFSIEEQVALLKRDWMTKGFLSEVFVDDIKSFNDLSNDPILGNKITLLGKTCNV